MPRPRRDNNIKKKYKQFYRKEWENEFGEWLQSIPGDRSSAICIYCKKKMLAHHRVLVDHTNSRRHKRAISSGRKPDLSSIFIEDDQEEETPQYVYIKRESPSSPIVNIRSDLDTRDTLITTPTVKMARPSFTVSENELPSKDISAEMEDPYICYGRYIGNELSKVASYYSRQVAKDKINTVLFEVTIGKYNRRLLEDPTEITFQSDEVVEIHHPGVKTAMNEIEAHAGMHPAEVIHTLQAELIHNNNSNNNNNIHQTEVQRSIQQSEIHSIQPEDIHTIHHTVHSLQPDPEEIHHSMHPSHVVDLSSNDEVVNLHTQSHHIILHQDNTTKYHVQNGNILTHELHPGDDTKFHIEQLNT